MSQFLPITVLIVTTPYQILARGNIILKSNRQVLHLCGFPQGFTHVQHIKCMTEERSTINGVANLVKKEEIKMEEWNKILKSMLSKPNISHPVKQFLQELLDRSKIPRMRIKFFNFVNIDINIFEQTWNVLESHKNDSQKPVTWQ